MISGKISKIIFMLKRYQNIYPLNILKTIYCSLIQSKLSYGLLLWGVDSRSIFILQKRAIRTITCSKFYSHTEPLFKELQILNINDLYTLRVLKFCFKLYNSDSPSYFLTYINSIKDKCLFYNLRNKHIRTPMHNHSFAKNNLLFECIRILQDTQLNVTEKMFTHSFKAFTFYAKKHLLNSYNATCIIPNCFTCLSYN